MTAKILDITKHPRWRRSERCSLVADLRASYEAAKKEVEIHKRAQEEYLKNSPYERYKQSFRDGEWVYKND